MNDLPTSGVGSSAKEVEPGGGPVSDGLKDATSQEFNLPKEVASAGVSAVPTVVSIPKSVVNLGVTPAGQNIPVQTQPTVSMPLSDDEIASGLNQGITNSLRWLAEWCVRRFKQLHIAVKTVHGKLVRV